MIMSSTCPSWLQTTVKSRSHFYSIYEELNKREYKRKHAQDASRSPTHRTTDRRNQLSNIVSGLNPLSPRSVDIQEYSVSIGSLPENRSSNRYGNIEPFDRTRVILNLLESQGEGRYINASWTRERYGGKWWISTQAPLPNTAHAFLSVLLQPITQPPASLCPEISNSSGPCRVRTVVQLTLSTEGGRTKAHPFFPSKIGQAYIVPPENGCRAQRLKITLIDQKTIEGSKCVQSTVKLCYLTEPDSEAQGDGVTFQHLLYTAWPDHDVPSPADRPSLLSFARLVSRLNRETSSSSPEVHSDPPIIVGCSAGIGRTGSFITLCSLLRAHRLLLGTSPNDSPPPPLPESPLGSLPADIAEDEVAQEIDSLREQRPGMVQGDKQMLFIYELLLEAFTSRNGTN